MSGNDCQFWVENWQGPPTSPLIRLCPESLDAIINLSHLVFVILQDRTDLGMSSGFYQTTRWVAYLSKALPYFSRSSFESSVTFTLMSCSRYRCLMSLYSTSNSCFLSSLAFLWVASSPPNRLCCAAVSIVYSHAMRHTVLWSRVCSARFFSYSASNCRFAFSAPGMSSFSLLSTKACFLRVCLR